MVIELGKLVTLLDSIMEAVLGKMLTVRVLVTLVSWCMVHLLLVQDFIDVCFRVGLVGG